MDDFDSLSVTIRKVMVQKMENKIGCGLIVAKTRNGEIKCGEEMWGKKRYCAYCQNIIENSHIKPNRNNG